MQEKEILSAQQAARILGCTPQKVREHIRRGIWKFGECIPKERTGKSVDEFNIFRSKLYKFMGKGV